MAGHFWELRWLMIGMKRQVEPLGDMAAPNIAFLFCSYYQHLFISQHFIDRQPGRIAGRNNAGKNRKDNHYPQPKQDTQRGKA